MKQPRRAGRGVALGLSLGVGALGCPQPRLDEHATRVDGPGVGWRSPSGLQGLTWRSTRWDVQGNRLVAEVALEAPDGAHAVSPITWRVRDVIGEIGHGPLQVVGDGSALTGRLVAELPRPPPRVLGLGLEIGDGDRAWTPVHRPGPETLTLRLPSGDPRVPETTIPWAPTPPELDGALDDPVWGAAPVLTLGPSSGRGEGPPPERATTLRLLWDREHLYVGFDARDPDVTERFRKRDDPIYDHEAVEVFLMPHVDGPETGPYVELQASPTAVIFDASFTGPRQGMDPTWNGGQTVVSKVEGSLDAPAVDRGWVSEWRVPWSSLRWVRNTPGPGDVWRMNAFRIDRSRGLSDLYVAWSPPRVGDFHRVERFGFATFGPRTSTTTETR